MLSPFPTMFHWVFAVSFREGNHWLIHFLKSSPPQKNNSFLIAQVALVSHPLFIFQTTAESLFFRRAADGHNPNVSVEKFQ